jgi:hypothetical protein
MFLSSVDGCDLFRCWWFCHFSFIGFEELDWHSSLIDLWLFVSDLFVFAEQSTDWNRPSFNRITQQTFLPQFVWKFVCGINSLCDLNLDLFDLFEFEHKPSFWTYSHLSLNSHTPQLSLSWCKFSYWSNPNLSWRVNSIIFSVSFIESFDWDTSICSLNSHWSRISPYQYISSCWSDPFVYWHLDEIILPGFVPEPPDWKHSFNTLHFDQPHLL